MKRNGTKLLSVLLAAVLLLGLLPGLPMTAHAAADVTSAAADSAVTLYADYGDGFELLSSLCFEKSVTEQTVTVTRPISALRVVKGDCYELNLDQLTLNGVCPAGYERKLSAADNDLIEIVDSQDFALSGTGELVIAARAPVEVLGENCSFKFPQINRGPIVPGSFFYSYVPGSNPGSFPDGEALIVPDKAYLFDSGMCYPDSGHPDAPMDIYVADDGETLYVFFEAFIDNTFDHGKDFAGVHVKCGETVKTYKIHTTEENEYGRWWFGYTDSSDEYDWEHMCYLVEVPLADLETEDGALDLAFEYYGTAGYQGKDLVAVAIGDVFLVADTNPENYWTNPHEHWPDAELLPGPGKTRNAAGGDTAEGEWWITNNGTDIESDYTLTLNGATIDSRSEVVTSSNYTDTFAPLYSLGNLTIELAEGTVNTIDYDDPSSNYDYGIEGECQELIIQGAGTLNVSADYRPISVNNLLTIRDGAEVNATINTSHQSSSSWGGTYTYNCVDVFGLTVDDASLTAAANVSVPSDSNDTVYVEAIEIGSTMHELTVKNDAVVEASASGSNSDNGSSAIGWYGDDVRLTLEAITVSIFEGADADSAVEVGELNTEYVYYSTRSMPYVRLEAIGTLYPLWLAETQVTSLNMDDLSAIDGVEGDASYDPTSNTLCLNGVTITAPEILDGSNRSVAAGIRYEYTSDGPHPLNIEADGKNSVLGPEIIAEGSGLGGTQSYGICAQGSPLNIILNEGSELTATGGTAISDRSCGIFAEIVSITGTGTLRAIGGTTSGESIGLYGYGRLWIGIPAYGDADASASVPEGPVVEAAGGASGDSSYGIQTYNSAGNLTIVGSNVTATGAGTGEPVYESSFSNGIRALGSLSIVESEVVASGGTEATKCYGIYTNPNGQTACAISNSDVTASGGTAALSNAPRLQFDEEGTVAAGSANVDGTAPEVYDAEKNDTYLWFQVPYGFMITFADEDGTELQSGKVPYGKMPEYEGDKPEKEADAQYTYVFAGWAPEVAESTEDVTYTAVYDKTVNKYTVIFEDEDGTELQNSKVAYGKVPVYEGEKPVKAADRQYSYEFTGWDTDIVAVTEDATYTAVYDKTVNKYTVIFEDEDGTELQNSKVAYGEIPVYEGEKPVKAADEKYTYTFTGWDPEITEVAEDATYKAVFTSEAIPEPEPEPEPEVYTILFVDEDGTQLQSSKVAKGEMPVYEGEIPVKTADGKYIYTFSGWDPEITEAAADVTYKAVFTAEAIPEPEPEPEPEDNNDKGRKSVKPESKAPFPFTDVPEDAYFRKAVEWALEKGVTGGTTPTTFSPLANATRGQVVTFLWGASGAPEPKTEENPFKDISEKNYYYKAVLWAYENSITAGISADEFGPEQTVKRGQVVTFLYGIAGRPEPKTGNPFGDIDEGDYYYKPALWAYEKGITAGTTATTFGPEDDCLRGQIITFLYLYFAE